MSAQLRGMLRWIIVRQREFRAPPIPNTPSIWLLSLIALIITLCGLQCSQAHARMQPSMSSTLGTKRIPVVCSHGYDLHGYDKVLPAIRSALESSGFNFSGFFAVARTPRASSDRIRCPIEGGIISHRRGYRDNIEWGPRVYCETRQTRHIYTAA